MTTARTRTLKAVLKHPGTGALLANHQVSIRLYGNVKGYVEDGTAAGEKTTVILGDRFAWTDENALLTVPGMECNTDIAPTNTAYSILLVKKFAPVVFVLPPGSVNGSDAWLFDNIEPDPANPDPVIAGVSVADFLAYQALVTSTYVSQTQFTTWIGAAPSTLDTLKELADALGDDANFATTMATALANRLEFDAPQTLNGTQIAQAQANLGLDAGGF